MAYDVNAYMRNYWRTHPEQRAKIKLAKAKRRLDNIEWIKNYLVQHPCADCNESDLVVLEFDHARGVKTRDVMGLLGGSIKSIENEIAKCDVVCANCHTRRTARRLNGYRWGWRSL